MRLDVKGFAIAFAIWWGGMVLVVGLCNLAWAPYGSTFLGWIASIYPGYDGPAGFGSVIVATLYGVVDGLIGGGILAWLYNAMSRSA